MQHSNAPANPPPEPKDLIDPEVLLGWALLFLSFIRKRKWLPLSLMLVMGAFAIASLKVLPKTYESSVTMQAKKSEYLSPDRAGQLIDDADVVLHRRETLLNIVKRTELVKEWKARREPIFRLKDQIYGWLIGPTSDRDLEVITSYLLHDGLSVTTEGDTITITVAWRDPEIAFRLVSAAQQAFLEERHVQEIAMLSESLGILDNHAASLEREINQSIEIARDLVARKNKELKAESAKKAAENDEEEKRDAPAVVRRAPSAPAPEKPAVDEAALARLAELETSITSKREQLAGLTSGSQAAVADLQGKLAQARAIYKEAHPAIADLKQQIQIAQADSPMVARLRSEIETLETERASLRTRTGAHLVAAASPGSSLGRAGVASLGARTLQNLKEVEEFQLEDPDIDYARSQIGFAMRKYQDTQLQIDAARLKLDTAQAAFRHRYRIVTPAEAPNKPTKPKPASVILGALFGGLALGTFIALALELRRGLIYEPWQVESSLGLPVVAHIELGSEPQRLI